MYCSKIARRRVLEALAPHHHARLAVAAEDDRRTGNAHREGALAQQAQHQRAHLAGGRDHGNPIAAAHAFQGIYPRERAVSANRRSEAAARARVTQPWAERGHGMFVVRDRATNQFLGRVGLKYWPQFDETEVGWVLRRDAWGHGYATEAGRACIDWGFGQLAVPYLTAMIRPTISRRSGLLRGWDWRPYARMCCLATTSWCTRSAVEAGNGALAVGRLDTPLCVV
jgi:hypothetical protein